MSISLYPHQRTAVDALSSGKILWGGVGTGKSLTAATYYVEKEAPRDVIVITTARKRDIRDWEKEFIKVGVSSHHRSPALGGAKLLAVDSWNNIAKYKNIRGAFFIFDEQRLVGSGAWVKAFQFIAKPQNNNTWIMLSATPGDNWLDYAPVFVANGFFKNITHFKREHVEYDSYAKFPKIKRYHGVNKLVRLRNDLLIHMPYERHTTRVTQNVTVTHDQVLLDKVLKERWNPYEERPIRSLAEFFYLMRKVVYSDPSRLQAVQAHMKRHQKLIVFYNFDYELEALRTLAPSNKPRVWNAESDGKKPNDNCVYVGRPSKWGNPFVIGKDGNRTEVLEKFRNYLLSSEELMGQIRELRGRDLVCWCSPSGCHADILLEIANRDEFKIAEWNGHKHEDVPDGENWIYLVQYTAGAEAWNCTTTDAMIFYSLTYSYKQWHQAHGRIDRLNTPFSLLHYYVLLSDAAIDRAVLTTLKTKHSFNEVKFSKKFSTMTLAV